MSDGASHKLLPLAGNLMAAPMETGRLAWAIAAREAIIAHRADAVFVEYPQALGPGIERLIDSLPAVQLLGWRIGPGRAYMIPSDPCDARIEAVRLAVENGIPCHFVDDLPADPESDRSPELPDPVLAENIGSAELARLILEGMPLRLPTPSDQTMARRVARLSAQYERPVFIGRIHRLGVLRELIESGAAKAAGQSGHDESSPAEELRWQVFPVSERNLGAVMHEIPAVAFRWEKWRSGEIGGATFSPANALESLLRGVADLYKLDFQEDINLTEWRAISQFARNLALVRGSVQPRLYELVMAAKCCVDGDFGLVTLKQSLIYPPNSPYNEEGEPDEEPVDRSRHASLMLHGDFDGDTERLTHAYDPPKLQEVTFRFRQRPFATEFQKDRWREAFLRSPGGICSWPPEDEFIEKFFRTIRQRAYLQISDNHSTSEEFTSSALDGLDVRETLRNWHRKKLYVRRDRVPPGKVGPVVLIWQDFPFIPGEIALAFHHPLWRTTLYAEHQNESDIAFYSTLPGREMIGPGITRIDYFGILSVYPSRKIPDIWSPSVFTKKVFQMLPGEPTHARVLIAMGLLMSEERYVAVVGPHPPDSGLRQLARQLNRGLIYLPLGTFSKAQLKRARKCHILSGNEVRGWAGDYIAED